LSRGDRSRPGRERTAAERERDRLERARRRAGAGEPSPSPDDGELSPTSTESSTPEPLRVESQRPLVEPLPPAPPEPEAQPEQPLPLVEPLPTVEPLPPVVALPPESAAVGPLPLEPPAQESVLPALPPRPEPAREPIETPASLAGAVPSPRRRSLASRLAALLALAAVVVAVVALLHAHDSKSVSPPAPPPVVKVLIPEGKTRQQIAQIAGADGLKGNYRLASRRSSLLNPVAYGAPSGTPDLEGFLFPATYDMDPGAPVTRLVQEQLVAFHENFGVSEIARARALHVTPYQLLIVASMVEREAQIPSDRPKIAAVIYNRLAAGMPLGIDASIYYAVELATGIPTYTHELTEAQLHIDSPYNTRTHVGLPPTPISNPGVASIEAAAHPAHVSYLYYVAGADGCGEQVFSNTLAQFEVNAAAYKAAVARGGGHPPTCKHK
jgi:cell division protein YceG involved in septum cleavage